jgi:N-acetylneuraminic acid mutarotase
MLLNRRQLFACSLFSWVLYFSLSSLSSAVLAATWSATGRMITARTGLTATMLPDGEVLVAGGAENHNDNPAFNSAELYNPSTGVWSATGSMIGARAWHNATLLPSGKVLVAGGWNNGDNLSSAEIYDPATRAWTATGSLTTPRQGGDATLLLDGRVLVAGGAGENPPTYTLASAEIYDPATESWSATGSMTTARRSKTMTLLPNGKVLIAGGRIKYTDTVHASAEIYDPATGSWSATGSMTTARQKGAATLLLDGRVLVAGGAGENPFTYMLDSAEIYDPATEVWTTTGSMTTGRGGVAFSLISNGKVLVAGGVDGKSVILASAEIYDPATEVWTTTGSMTTGRGQPATVLLSTGRVLVIGGFYSINGDSLASAELFRINSTLVPSFIMPLLLSE